LAFVVADAFTVSLGGVSGCHTVRRPAVGGVATAVHPPDGITVSSLTWKITNGASSFSRSGTVDLHPGEPVAFRVGDVPAGNGYTLDLIGTPGVDGAATCAGSAAFDVTPGGSASLSVRLY
jgi:hypothetical protein